MSPTANFINAAVAHLQDGQCHLCGNDCPRVVTCHIDQLVLQIDQDRAPLCQPLLSVLQLPLNALGDLHVAILNVKQAPHILHSTSQEL